MTAQPLNQESAQALRAENEQLRRDAAFYKSANEILAFKLDRLVAKLAPYGGLENPRL